MCSILSYVFKHRNKKISLALLVRSWIANTINSSLNVSTFLSLLGNVFIYLFSIQYCVEIVVIAISLMEFLKLDIWNVHRYRYYSTSLFTKYTLSNSRWSQCWSLKLSEIQTNLNGKPFPIFVCSLKLCFILHSFNSFLNGDI